MVYDSQSGDITMALAGDALITRPFRVHKEPTFLGLAEIFRSADVGFCNLEGTVRNWDEGTPNYVLGTHATLPPQVVEDLRWFGVNLVSCANNHAGEYGEGGIMATVRHVENAGVVHAGIGANLTQAASPGYLETNRGRVALVSASSSFLPWRAASDQGNELHGRPGINPLGWKKVFSVDEEAFHHLQRAARELGLEKERAQMMAHFTSQVHFEEAAQETVLFGNRMVKADKFGVTWELNQKHVAENLRWIKEAKRQADWVVYSLHSHETSFDSTMKAANMTEMEAPAEFVEEIAHAVIDAGADVFVGHGRQIPYGIEIYKGRPIFYGLGQLFFESETIRFYPKEDYQVYNLPEGSTPADRIEVRTDGGKRSHAGHRGFWENIVVECQFKGGKFSEAKLYPTESGYGLKRSQRGRPVLAGPEVSARVLERMQRLCKRYGTNVAIDGNVGVVKA